MRKGQVLVVTLLVLSVIVTIALSVASRSVTEVQVSTTQDESTRALEAAEIGLERYLGTQMAEHQDVPALNASYNLPPPADIGGGSSFAVPYSLVNGDAGTVDLPAGNFPWVKVCWGDGNVLNPKIEVEFYYEDASHQVYVRRHGYDPDSNPATRYSGFYSGISGPDRCGTGKDFSHNFLIHVNDPNENNGNNGRIYLNLTSNKAIFMRIRMLGNGSTPQFVAVQLPGGFPLPPQGGIVESVGVAGSTSQKVRATVSYWDLPAMFDSAIFSGTELTKD